jgi:hypothetical protein
METHFHLYPKLNFYIEIEVTNTWLSQFLESLTGGIEANLQVITSKYDRNLIEDSGYKNVIQQFMQALRLFSGSFQP